MNTLNQLGFADLRKANMKRLPLFKKAKSGTAHSDPEGRDWSPAQWLQAVVGELGEYANFRKKFERGDIDLEEFIVKAGFELADTVTYLDILAFQLGIDLGQVVQEKFNLVSERVGCNVKIVTEEGHSIPYRMLSELYGHVTRLRQTATVDDDFPEMMHKVDSMLRAIENHKKAGH